jgi:hypothetical protein
VKSVFSFVSMTITNHQFCSACDIFTKGKHSKTTNYELNNVFMSTNTNVETVQDFETILDRLNVDGIYSYNYVLLF